ncbi:rubredoxin-NAD(+) reductase, partial [Aureobasidium melanogenum]
MLPTERVFIVLMSRQKASPIHPIMVPKPALASGTNHPGALLLFCFGPHRLRQHPSQARKPQRPPLSHAVVELFIFILQNLRVNRLLNPTQILHELLELESLQQDGDFKNVDTLLDLALAGHLLASHQLGALCHVGILHHAGDCNNLFALVEVGDKARSFLCICLALNDNVVVAICVLSDVPMLDANRLAVTSRTVVGLDLLDVLKVVGRRSDTDTLDNEICRLGRLSTLDLCTHLELGTVLLDQASEGLSKLLAHDSHHRLFLHTNDGDIVLHASETVANLHTDEGATNNDNLLATILTCSLHDALGMGKCTKNKDVLEISLQAVHREPLGSATRSHDELCVVELLAVISLNGTVVEIDLRNIAPAPYNLGLVCDESLGELGTVEGLCVLARDDSDLALVAATTEAFDGTESTTAASDNDNMVLLFYAAALEVELASVGLDCLLLALDVDGTVTLEDLEFGQGVKCWGILDVTGGYLEAGCKVVSVEVQQASSQKHERMIVLTSVPRAGDSALASKNTLDQRSTVVGAVGTHGVNLILDLGQQNLSALNAVDFNLLLLAVLQVYARKPLELVFETKVEKFDETEQMRSSGRVTSAPNIKVEKHNSYLLHRYC